MDQREKSYLELLTKRFDESSYINFIKDLLNLSQFDISNTLEERKDIPKQYKENIDYYKYIAKYNDGINNIGILVVKFNDKTSTNARTSQRNFVATILSKYDLDASLVAFYSDTESNWRLSFVKKELNFTEKGFKVELTPAKRYSYLVGESESVHTAQEFLLKLLKINDRKIKLEDIEQVFDVEKVTKRFFEEYKEKYLQLKEYLDKNEDFKTESEKADFTSVEFAKKLMGQIVFLYFLQKKGWLGVQLVPNELNLIEFQELYNSSDSVAKNLLNKFYEKQEEFYVIDKTKLKTTDSVEDIINLSNLFKGTAYDNNWGTGKKDFIRSIYKQAIKEHKNFFDDYLEPFFYRGLNEKRDNQYFPLFNCKIPFLNGGLFEPLNNYRWSSAYFNIPNSMFSNDNKDGILDFLDLYNFTIDEEEPLEKEVAVDPEMLGKIFENLLEVNDRKSKGAFYTPREIVYYMCQESLANYLTNKVNVNYDEIINFIKYGDLITQLDLEKYNNSNDISNFSIGNTIYDNLLEIDDALINVKIADPAVGSGAFPLGMLTEIIKIRSNLSNYMNIKNELNSSENGNIKNIEQSKRKLFDMKLQTIENCIYAVDIETSAIDITKLRLWLSLIVDYPNEEEPRPLPNLDCKIMQGNSLVDEFDGVPLFSEKILMNNLKNYKRKDSDIFEVRDIHIQQTLQLDENSIDLNSYIDKMLLLQKEYFKTSDNKLKKELKNKIDSIQFGMIEESLKNNPDRLRKFKDEESKKSKPWFVWRLEFFDVFKNNGGFDIVIGNPPYVQLQKDNGKLADELKNQGYETFTRSGDIYCLFYEKGINLLKENGIECFITSNKWLRTGYGEKLRGFLSKINPLLLINFCGNKVFESAQVDVNILITEKSRNKKCTKTSEIHENYKGNLETSINNSIVVNSYTDSSNWVLMSNIESSIKNKVEKFGKKLSDWNIAINYGIKTGYNDAFLINQETYNYLVNINDKNKEILKPILRGRDIRQYNCNFSNLWMIVSHNGYGNNKRINIDDYPDIKRYMDQFHEKLEKRYDKGDTIYNLRNCAYMDDLSKPKIMYSEIVREPQFYYDNGYYYPEASTFFISGEKLEYIICALNSKITGNIFKSFYAGGGLGEKGYRYKKTFLVTLPLPEIDDNEYNLFKNYLKQINNNISIGLSIEKELKEIDEFICRKYHFTDDEIEYLSEVSE